MNTHTTATRLFLGATLFVAGASKLWNPWALAESIQQYHILPSWLIGLGASILPGIEFLCGLCLIRGGNLLRGAALLATGLSAVFVAANLSALLRGLNINCGCFGLTFLQSWQLSWPHLAFNVLLILLALLLVKAPTESQN
jgi:hypothetical protein